MSLSLITPDLQVKWLLPHEMSLAQLSGVIRQRLSLSPSDQSQLFLMIQSAELEPGLPSLLTSVGSLHNSHSDTDGFLYIHYSSQEAYG